MRRKSFSPDTARAAGMGLAAALDSVLALLFTVVLARLLGADDYGSLAALVSAFLILSVAGTGLQATVAREIGWRRAPARESLSGLGLSTVSPYLLLSFLGLAAVSVALRHVLAAVIGVDEEWAAAATLPLAALWLFIATRRGALLGIGAYRTVALSVIGEPAGWLVFGVAAALLGLGVTGAFLGVALAELALALVLQAAVRGHTDAPSPSSSSETGSAGLWRLVRAASVPMAALALFAALQNLDVIAVQHLASEVEASSYAAASIAAKVVVWLAIGVGLYLLPEVARRTGEGLDGRPLLIRALGLVLAAAAPMIILYALAGRSLLELVFGPDLTAASDVLALLGVAMTLLAISYLTIQYLLALGRRGFLLIVAVAAVIEPVLLSIAGDDLEGVAIALVAVQLAVAAGLLGLALRPRPAALGPGRRITLEKSS